jgi:hypothetical protein
MRSQNYVSNESVELLTAEVASILAFEVASYAHSSAMLSVKHTFWLRVRVAQNWLRCSQHTWLYSR